MARIPIDRFLDANNEPQRRLSPIQDYEKKELVSLEEAVKPLEHIIENIQGFVWTATGNCDNSQDGLSANERAAIYLYTMECMYQQLNTALRNENRQYLLPYFSYLKLFLTALWKLTDTKCLVYRGVKGDISQFYSEGNQCFWWGLSSCTSKLSVLQTEQFLGQSGTRTLFNIEFRSKIDAGHGLHIVQLKQIEAPVKLLQPPSSSFASSCAASNTLETKTKKTFKLSILKEQPRVSIKDATDGLSMAANDKYLLASVSNKLVLIDKHGQKQEGIEKDFGVFGIYWSSHLNQFLLLTDTPSNRLYSLDIFANGSHRLKVVKQFDKDMQCCTCYDTTFLISSKLNGDNEECYIEEFNLSNWKLKTTFRSPISCTDKECVIHMQFNSTGSYLGVLLANIDHNSSNYQWSFQLRRPNNMNILKVMSLGTDRFCGLTALPNEQFLVHSYRQQNLFLIDSDGKLNETLFYDHDESQSALTAVIGTECLVISSANTNKLHFYDL